MDPRDTFDAVADLYAEVRPGYPAALFDDLEALAGLGPSATVLESSHRVLSSEAGGCSSERHRATA